MGHEKKDYEMAQLKELLLASCSKMLGTPLRYPKWETETSEPKAKAAPPPKAAPAASTAVSLATHADVTNPVFIAERAGFKINSLVYEKNEGGKSAGIENCFIIESISFDGTVLLAKAKSYNPGAGYTGKVALAELLQKWALSNVSPPIKLNAKQCRPSSMMIDNHKCVIYQSLIAADCHSNAANQSLEFWKRGDQIRTSIDLKEGALVLFPMT